MASPNDNTKTRGAIMDVVEGGFVMVSAETDARKPWWVRKLGRGSYSITARATGAKAAQASSAGAAKMLASTLNTYFPHVGNHPDAGAYLIKNPFERDLFRGAVRDPDADYKRGKRTNMSERGKQEMLEIVAKAGPPPPIRPLLNPPPKPSKPSKPEAPQSLRTMADARKAGTVWAREAFVDRAKMGRTYYEQQIEALHADNPALKPEAFAVFRNTLRSLEDQKKRERLYRSDIKKAEKLLSSMRFGEADRKDVLKVINRAENRERFLSTRALSKGRSQLDAIRNQLSEAESRGRSYQREQHARKLEALEQAEAEAVSKLPQGEKAHRQYMRELGMKPPPVTNADLARAGEELQRMHAEHRRKKRRGAPVSTRPTAKLREEAIMAARRVSEELDDYKVTEESDRDVVRANDSDDPEELRTIRDRWRKFMSDRPGRTPFADPLSPPLNDVCGPDETFVPAHCRKGRAKKEKPAKERVSLPEGVKGWDEASVGAAIEAFEQAGKSRVEAIKAAFEAARQEYRKTRKRGRWPRHLDPKKPERGLRMVDEARKS